MSDTDTSSAYAKVFSATSEAAVSAKSIATATGLPYKEVQAHLKTLAENGQVESSKDGSRTVWTRAAQTPADEPAAPASLTEAFADAISAEAHADAPAADVPPAIDTDSMSLTALRKHAKDVYGIERMSKADRTTVLDAILRARTVAAEQQVTRDYSDLTVGMLRTEAKTLGVPGTVSKMGRDALLTAIAAHLVASDAPLTLAPDSDTAQTAADEPAAQTAAPDAQTAAETAVAPDGPWGGGDAAGAPSGSLDAILADLQDARPVSAPPAQVARSRTPRADGAPAGGIVSSGQARAWTRGELEGTLLAEMQKDPDCQYSATSLTKWWNDTRAPDAPVAQSGSVAFALDALVKKGTVRLAQDKPKRYAPAVVPLAA